VRLYLCFELDWDVRLVLRKNQVPPLTLGSGRQLGWTAWLGHRRAPGDADDLCIDAESFAERGFVQSHADDRASMQKGSLERA
jgi:type VI secretion system protein ImpH